MTLLLVAVFWFLFALAAGSLVGKCIDFEGLLGHSEAEQEGEQSAARALGNATGAQATDKRLRSPVLTVQQPREVPCSSAVVELDAVRIRRANRGHR